MGKRKGRANFFLSPFLCLLLLPLKTSPFEVRFTCVVQLNTELFLQVQQKLSLKCGHYMRQGETNFLCNHHARSCKFQTYLPVYFREHFKCKNQDFICQFYAAFVYLKLAFNSYVFLVPTYKVQWDLQIQSCPSVRLSVHTDISATPWSISIKLCTRMIPYGIQMHINLFSDTINFSRVREIFVTIFSMSYAIIQTCHF